MANIVDIQCSEDTWVNQEATTTNYGSSEYLNIVGYNSGYWRRAFLKFPLQVDMIGANIISATLYCYLYSNDNTSRPQQHRLKRVTSDWSEGVATWANQPSFYGSGSLDAGAYDIFEPASKTTGYWRDADLTLMVQEWAGGVYPNYGVCIDTPYYNSVNGGYWASINYCSSNHTNTSLRPYLRIEYEASGGAAPARRYAQFI